MLQENHPEPPEKTPAPEEEKWILPAFCNPKLVISALTDYLSENHLYFYVFVWERRVYSLGHAPACMRIPAELSHSPYLFLESMQG